MSLFKTVRSVMSRGFVLLLLAFVVAASAGVKHAAAQTSSSSSRSDDYGHYDGSDIVKILPGPDSGATQAIVRRIEDGNRHCSELDPVYRIDCLRASYAWVAEEAAKLGPEYAEAAVILGELSSDLDRVVTENLDTEAPRARSPRPAIRKKDTQYRAVKRENLAKANAEAVQAIDKAVKALQRSATGRRAAAYQRIAEAVDSSKVLLRSA
ncbi:hypothetical protein [Jiella sonneratiae]|uniref:Secreted protein n=1 Tax=Jiella sonneratiae TaxID=2816856 RepID=A0ABS3J818_9HYPH|nr:hypothetical protein [Jiella sonneratiae]MBO0905805.1 hypothetical protein [Jiella sonneratiae]